MDNTNPVPDPQEPEVIPPARLEMHRPEVPPIEYLEADERPRIGILALVRSLWGEVILGTLAALLAGGILWHFAHRKPAAPPAPVHTSHHKKHASASKSKSAKHSAKKTKKAAQTTPAQSGSSSSKSKPKPWFSSRETNG